MATVIDTCASLTAEQCGAYVQGTCAAVPQSCGIYPSYLDGETFGAILAPLAGLILLAYGFKIGKKLLGWNY